jgi:hypothetical protein
MVGQNSSLSSEYYHHSGPAQIAEYYWWPSPLLLLALIPLDLRRRMEDTEIGPLYG